MENKFSLTRWFYNDNYPDFYVVCEQGNDGHYSYWLGHKDYPIRIGTYDVPYIQAQTQGGTEGGRLMLSEKIVFALNNVDDLYLEELMKLAPIFPVCPYDDAVS